MIKRNNVCTTGVPEEEREKGMKSWNNENFPDMGRELDIQVHEGISRHKISTQHVLQE